MRFLRQSFASFFRALSLVLRPSQTHYPHLPRWPFHCYALTQRQRTIGLEPMVEKGMRWNTKHQILAASFLGESCKRYPFLPSYLMDGQGTSYTFKYVSAL
eukprot:m.5412 g.5412  ORF g.5412 m.5412 type:complete len:101 (-) comp5449_c0_seq1:193-495(-)